MSNTLTTHASLKRRHARVRAKIHGTAERPRLSVRISLAHIVTQLIDDERGHTLAQVSTIGAKDAKSQTRGGEGTMTAKAEWVGTQIAAAAKAKKIKAVVFDRGGRIYHGRLHALAEAARKAGLEF